MAKKSWQPNSIGLLLATMGFGLLSVGSRADGDVIEVQRSGRRLSLGIASETAYLAISGAAFFGQGVRVNLDYAFTPTWALRMAIGQTMRVDIFPPRALYFGAGLYSLWSLLGTLSEDSREISIAGRPAVKAESAPRKHVFIVGLGAEEFLLNGENSVFPASGPSVMVEYGQLWRHVRASAGVRTGILVSNNKTVVPVVLSLGISTGF